MKVLLFALLVIIIYLVATYIRNTTEGMTDVSNEAIQNIAKVYNNENMKITNCDITKNLTVSGSVNFLPKGVIVAWNGSVAPEGWAICDGTNGTPDLRGRFILSAGQGMGLTLRNINDNAGTETHTLTIAEMPTHAHPGATPDGNNSCECGGGTCICGMNFSGTQAVGGNQAHNNMPPYYVLAYIMRIK